ncbi:MAG: UDP-N-acetylmuramate dehydrogenase [bacterium]
MKIAENISLKPYHTFGIEVKARYLAELTDRKELPGFLSSLGKDHKPLLFIGGGSNLLFTRDFQGTVVRIMTRGITVKKENPGEVFLAAEAGEPWDDVVKFAVGRNWGGLENMSLIPGNAGTAPVQNIGAYGAELKDVLWSLDVFDLGTLESHTLLNSECGFGYRESIFKQAKGKFLILGVTLKLSKKPVLKLDYGQIREELEHSGVSDPTLSEVREAVIRIRTRKLPDPSVHGNAGSFFKNPVVSGELLDQIRFEHPEVVFYPFGDQFKIAAAWLIEQCGWKGRRQGDAGVYPNQPLVLVNYGSASGKEILDLASQIRNAVFEKFGIALESEVNIF